MIGKQDTENTINLYEEIMNELEDQNLEESDIRYVTVNIFDDKTREYRTVSLEVNSFLEATKNINYDPGFGWEEIPISLKIIGDNWWLERHEYDGSEWFEFKTLPKVEGKPFRVKKAKKINTYEYGFIIET